MSAPPAFARFASRPSRWRWRTALVVLALLAPGLIEVHPAAAGHAAIGSGDEKVSACATGHRRSAHVESARTVEPHDCAACLHRLHSRGGGAGVVGPATLAAAGGAPPGLPPAAAPFPPLAQAPSRGPPLA
jgi:hypothetical protein